MSAENTIRNVNPTTPTLPGLPMKEVMGQFLNTTDDG
jgi:hypothetical protein